MCRWKKDAGWPYVKRRCSKPIARIPNARGFLFMYNVSKNISLTFIGGITIYKNTQLLISYWMMENCGI